MKYNRNYLYRNNQLRGRRLYENKSWYPDDYSTYASEYQLTIKPDIIIKDIFDFIADLNYSNRNPATWAFLDFYNMLSDRYLTPKGTPRRDSNAKKTGIFTNHDFLNGSFFKNIDESVMVDVNNNKVVPLFNYPEYVNAKKINPKDKSIVRKYKMILLQNLWTYLQKTYRKELTFKVAKLKPNIKKIVKLLERGDYRGNPFVGEYSNSTNPIDWDADDFKYVFLDSLLVMGHTLTPEVADAFGFPKSALKLKIYDFLMRNGGVYLNGNKNYNQSVERGWVSWKTALYDLWDFLVKKYPKQLDFSNRM